MSSLLGIFEVALVTLCFELSIERIWRAFAGEIGSREVEILMGLSVFAVLCVLLGAWLQLRLSRALAELAIGIAVGVIVAFVVRALTGDVPFYRSDLPLLAGLVVLNAGLIVLGILLAIRRRGGAFQP